jgi:serine/threonine protein kinase
VVAPAPAVLPARAIGRYLLFGEIAAGGMATVHFGRLSGPAGFSRTVAIKRLHPNLAKDPEFVAMFLDEARLAARIRHPNVVPTLDVVATEGEIFLVMDYVQGESLSRLRIAMQDAKRQADPRIIAAIMSGVLHGLHAAHEAKSEQGQSLNIVHRDVSPQNVLVGIEGVARVLDFGVAKAIGRVQTTREGQIKGKLAYMPPEQLRGGRVTRQADVYAAAVVTWEALTGARLFSGEHEGALVTSILMHPIKAPSEVAPHLPAAFDAVVMRGLDRDPAKRYPTAREMALDLERCAGVASTSEVGEWVESLAGTELSKRAALMAAIEGSTPTRPSERIRLPVSSTTSDMPTNPAPSRSTVRRLPRRRGSDPARVAAPMGPYCRVCGLRRRRRDRHPRGGVRDRAQAATGRVGRSRRAVCHGYDHGRSSFHSGRAERRRYRSVDAASRSVADTKSQSTSGSGDDGPDAGTAEGRLRHTLHNRRQGS